MSKTEATNEQRVIHPMKSKLREVWLDAQSKQGRRITQKEIAEATGIRANTISRWMTKEPMTRIEHSVLEPLCVFFNVKSHDIVYLEGIDDID